MAFSDPARKEDCGHVFVKDGLILGRLQTKRQVYPKIIVQRINREGNVEERPGLGTPVFEAIAKEKWELHLTGNKLLWPDLQALVEEIDNLTE